MPNYNENIDFRLESTTMTIKVEQIKPVGSGNFFLDMGHSPEEAALLSLKSYLFMQLEDTAGAKLKSGKTQQQLAKELGTTQPILSNILNGKMSSFTLDHILNLLLKLKRDVHVCTMTAPVKRRAKVFRSMLVL
jgi:predicted XRE-type DNA-binding protein